jgi:hypothetical protein
VRAPGPAGRQRDPVRHQPFDLRQRRVVEHAGARVRLQVDGLDRARVDHVGMFPARLPDRRDRDGQVVREQVITGVVEVDRGETIAVDRQVADVQVGVGQAEGLGALALRVDPGDQVAQVTLGGPGVVPGAGQRDLQDAVLPPVRATFGRAVAAGMSMQLGLQRRPALGHLRRVIATFVGHAAWRRFETNGVGTGDCFHLLPVVRRQRAHHRHTGVGQAAHPGHLGDDLVPPAVIGRGLTRAPAPGRSGSRARAPGPAPLRARLSRTRRSGCRRPRRPSPCRR